jgi:hypothetical protein
MSSKVRIFICNWETEAECLQKNLFGDPNSWPMNVIAGENCVLFNYYTNMLHGLWYAESSGKIDIDPWAWKGKFKYQISVKLVSKERITLSSVEIKKLFPNNLDWYKQNTISGSVAQTVLSYFAS